MKTPMQELLERVKEYRDSETSPLVISRLNNICVAIFCMLEEEEDKIMDAYDAGLFDGSIIPYTSDDVDDNYFNKTFNTKLTQDTDGCSNDRSKCSCKNWGGCPVD